MTSRNAGTRAIDLRIAADDLDPCTEFLPPRAIWRRQRRGLLSPTLAPDRDPRLHALLAQLRFRHEQAARLANDSSFSASICKHDVPVGHRRLRLAAMRRGAANGGQDAKFAGGYRHSIGNLAHARPAASPGRRKEVHETIAALPEASNGRCEAPALWSRPPPRKITHQGETFMRNT